VSDPDGGARPEGRTQTGRAVVLVAIVALITVLVLRHSPGETSHQAAAATTTTTVVKGVTTPSVTTTTTLAPARPPSEVVVQVLNGLIAGSLAGDLSVKLHTTHGYMTLPAADTTSRTTASRIYVARTGYYPEAIALAGYLGLGDRSIYRRVPTSAPIPAGVVGHADLIVVIGKALQSQA
jgi:hypothetical protein